MENTKYTTIEVIEKLGVEDECLKNILYLVSQVREKANELGGKEIDFAFKQDVADRRVQVTTEIIAEIDDVIFWKE